jgi:fibronectin type 3 domain-containing protein
VKTHPARICLAPSSDRRCLPFGRVHGKAFALLIMVITLLATVMLSSCASTSEGLASSNSAANTSGTLTSPAQSSAVGSHDVTLSWNPSISSGVLGYNVYRGTGSGGPYTKLNPSIIAATNYRDNAVQSGQTYYYVVTATDSGNLESVYSHEVAAPIP